MTTRIALATIAPALALLAAPAAAQQGTDYEAIVRIMRECARIADVPARVACYDNSVKLEPQVSAAPAPRTPDPPRATGYGAETLPQTAAERAQLPSEMELTITAIEELAPRMYRLTLEDGGVWETTDAAPLSYDPPRRGRKITLNRGSLGGFLMEYAGQASMRIRRVR